MMINLKARHDVAWFSYVVYSILVIFVFIDSPREAITAPKWLFYAKDVLVITLFLIAVLYVVENDRPFFLLGGWFEVLMFLFVVYVVVGLFENFDKNVDHARYIKKFYVLMFYVVTLVFFSIQRGFRERIMFFMASFSVVLVIFSTFSYLFKEVLFFVDSSKLSLGRFVLGQPSITVFPLLVVLSYHLFVQAVFNSAWGVGIVVVGVLLSVSGAALGSLLIMFFFVLINNLRTLFASLFFVSVLMYFFWGGYGEFESAEVNRAFSLIEIKIKSIFQIEQDPSMSLRDYNYSNAVAGMGDSLGVGSGVMAWKEFTPWIENTYRVILLEMGYLGVFVFFMFLLEGVIYSAKRIVLMNACRQMGYFFLWFYLSLAGYALTLDVFHPFTLSFCIGFVLALRYSYSKSKYLSIKQNECALSARCA